MGKKLIHFPEAPGAGVKLLEEDFRVDHSHAIERLRRASENIAFGALEIELEQIDRLKSLRLQQRG